MIENIVTTTTIIKIVKQVTLLMKFTGGQFCSCRSNIAINQVRSQRLTSFMNS